MTDTPNLGLPLISEGLANERIVHNQALGILDAVTGNSVISKDTLAQPVSPAEGDTYIIDGVGTGTDWNGQDNNIAFFLGGIWNFIVPVEGIFFYARDIDERTEWNGAAWGPFTVSVTGLLTKYTTAGKSVNFSVGNNSGSSTGHTLSGLPAGDNVISVNFEITAHHNPSSNTGSSLVTLTAGGETVSVAVTHNAPVDDVDTTQDNTAGGTLIAIVQNGDTVVLSWNTSVQVGPTAIGRFDVISYQPIITP